MLDACFGCNGVLPCVLFGSLHAIAPSLSFGLLTLSLAFGQLGHTTVLGPGISPFRGRRSSGEIRGSCERRHRGQASHKDSWDVFLHWSSPILKDATGESPIQLIWEGESCGIQ